MQKTKGIHVVLAVIAIQLIIGVAYIWSVFQTGVANSIFGGDEAAAALTYSLLLSILTLGSAIGGKLAIKYSTRTVVFAGGVIMSIGFILASFVTANVPWMLWLTYGVMGGLGMGFTYSPTIACAQKWYPHKKGLVTGVIVATLGFGGVVFTPIVESLVSSFGGQGVGEPRAFMILGFVFLVVCTGGSFFMKNPPAGYMEDKSAANAAASASANDRPPSEIIKTPQFYLVTITLMLACMGGLMMIGFAKPIAVAKDLESIAAVGVLAITMFNSLGRLLWGMISDKLGRYNTLLILLLGNAALSLCVNLAEGLWVFVLIALIGFFYGGLLSNFPALTAELFGPKHMAANYGFVLLGFGVGAIVSSQIAGYYKNIAAGDISLMFPAFVIASCCAAAGFIMMLILRRMSRPKAKAE